MDNTCWTCDRNLDDPWATKPVPGVALPSGEALQHTTCPPGTCANCGTERPYADLIRVELADGELWDDPNMLVCSNVYKCQVRTGELEPDDVPQAARG